MGYDDRDWSGREPSAGGRFFSRIFENVENPLGWSLKLFTFRGIVTRVHVFFVLFLVIEPLFSIDQGMTGVWWSLIAMVMLFGLVLIHEYGHCFACRRVGGVADRVVLLPWGGLALTMPPQDWRAHLITTIGGPAVHVVLAPVIAGAMLAAGLASQLVFNPFDMGAEFAQGWFLDGSTSGVGYWLRVGLFWLWAINLILLSFNVLLPFFPLDGGRVVQALLWRKTGYRRSMEAAVLIGFFGAGVLGVVGIALNQVMLVVIAAFGAFASWAERQRVRAEADIVGDAGPAVFQPGGVTHAPAARERGPTKRERKQAEREKQEEEQLDTLLDKIREHGMHSLSKQERATLDRLSKKRRGG